MSEYGLSREEAIDITSQEARGLLVAGIKRKKMEMELLAIINANAIGTMLVGEKKGGDIRPPKKGGKKMEERKKTVYWSGGRSGKKPDLSPNPKRARLKELAEMEPQPIDDFALGKFMKINQGSMEINRGKR